jgi:hypothetical protein
MVGNRFDSVGSLDDEDEPQADEADPQTDEFWRRRAAARTEMLKDGARQQLADLDELDVQVQRRKAREEREKRSRR